MSSDTKDLTLELTVFTYGYNERRTEIELRPVIPEAIRGDSMKIKQWVDGLAITMSPDFKFTNEWGCAVCGRTARESKYNVTYWTHIPRPRVVFYIHNLCQAGTNYCHRVIKEQELLIQAVAQAPFVPTYRNTDLDDLPESPYPAASSCANCHDEKTAKKGYKLFRCSACKLTRYCCPGCQKADWPRHKKACKVIESVKWVHWPA